MAEKNAREFYQFEDGQDWIIKIDDDTGDIISKTPIKEKRDKSKYFRKGEFSTMHQRLHKVLKDKKDYSNLTFRLLFELLDRIDFNNRIRTFRQAELANALEAHQPHVSNSLKVLENDEVIKKINHDYYFTPKFIRYVNDGSWSEVGFKPEEAEPPKSQYEGV